MKTVWIVGGTMGVGKTATCQIMKSKLPNSVFLDGDWCWDMHPFQVTEETKRMVTDNICYLLNSFIHCSAYENVIFCWVMHEQKIVDDILSCLDTADCRVRSISLVCSSESLKARLQNDVNAGLREPDIISRSINRLPLYEKLSTEKVDVSAITAEQAADQILQGC